MSVQTSFYIHWPYCELKCPYCDFNSHVTRDLAENEEPYLQALLLEIAYYADIYGTRRLSSIYFGGGTPSLMREQTIAKILNILSKFYQIEENAEITIEVNPASYIYERFKAYRAMGINRVSIGVQSFNDLTLKQLGRAHSAEEAIKALESAAELFSNYSFDLIYALHGQTIEAWRRELSYGLSFAAPHMSLYELTIEPNTKFAHLVQRGKLKVVSNEESAEFYEITQQIMNEANRPAYEVSNHAQKGFESKHNLAYWQYKEYIGVGPGAHSRVWLSGTPVVKAIEAEKQPKLWQNHLLETGKPLAKIHNLCEKEQAEELLLSSMRLRKGLDIVRFELLWGRSLCYDVIKELVTENLLEPIGEENRLCPTEKGLLFANYLVQRLTTI